MPKASPYMMDTLIHTSIENMEKNANPIDLIGSLYVYHLPAKGIEFDFARGVASVVLEDLDMRDNAYHDLRLCFAGVFSFASDYPANAVFAPSNCYSLACSEITEGRYEAVFVFMFAYTPLWRVKIGFTGIEISGGLSPEALAHREDYFKKMRAE